MEETLAKQRRSGFSLVSLMNTMSSISSFCWQRYMLFGTQKPQDRLEILRELDEDYVNLRQQQSILKGWRLFNSWTQVTESTTYMFHRHFAIGAIFEICGISKLRDMFHQVTNPPKLISLNGEYSHLFLDLVD